MPRPALRHATLLLALGLSPALAAPGVPVPQTASASLLPPSLLMQTAPEFRGGTLRGLILEGGELRLAPGASTGVFESAPLAASASFSQVLPSWNAAAPGKSSLTLEVRAETGGRRTKYYSFGRWGEGGRGSVNGQRDADGDVKTDTLILSRPASGLQYRLTLRGAGQDGPRVRRVTLTATGQPPKPHAAVPSAAWGKVLNVPPRSQMVFAQGEGWCSPTSVSMVLAYWGTLVTVPQAAAGTLDPTYGGTGNWAFNAAYAASLGFAAVVTRLTALADVERFVLANVPIVLSVGWKAGELPGAPISQSGGHLLVAVGFDAKGNVVVNDPAGKTDAEVRRTYDRAAFERLWLSHSGGAAYVIRPEELAAQ